MMEPRGAELGGFVQRSAGLQPWRRVFHASNGLLFVGILEVLDPPNPLVLLALAAILALQLALDGLRLAVPGANVLFFRFFAPLVSPREQEGIASSTWYTAGALLACALFPRPAAIGGVLVLALADPAANLVGRLWGKVAIGSDGTLEGTVAFFGVGFGALLLLADPLAAAAAAGVATVVERTPIPLDDNLTIPIAAAAALWIVGAG